MSNVFPVLPLSPPPLEDSWEDDEFGDFSSASISSNQVGAVETSAVLAQPQQPVNAGTTMQLQNDRSQEDCTDLHIPVFDDDSNYDEVSSSDRLSAEMAKTDSVANEAEDDDAFNDWVTSSNATAQHTDSSEKVLNSYTLPEPGSINNCPESSEFNQGVCQQHERHTSDINNCQNTGVSQSSELSSNKDRQKNDEHLSDFTSESGHAISTEITSDINFSKHFQNTPTSCSIPTEHDVHVESDWEEFSAADKEMQHQFDVHVEQEELVSQNEKSILNYSECIVDTQRVPDSDPTEDEPVTEHVHMPSELPSSDVNNLKSDDVTFNKFPSSSELADDQEKEGNLSGGVAKDELQNFASFGESGDSSDPEKQESYMQVPEKMTKESDWQTSEAISEESAFADFAAFSEPTEDKLFSEMEASDATLQSTSNTEDDFEDFADFQSQPITEGSLESVQVGVFPKKEEFLDNRTCEMGDTKVIVIY